MNNIYVDFHVLQTVPPSCVNRDDTGSPKTAVYGGVTRARVSSQSWKHAMKGMFSEELADEQLGYRTKHLANVVADHIRKIDSGLKKPEQLAEEILKKAGLDTKKDGKVSALFFISNRQARKLAETAIIDIEKDCESLLRDYPSIDMALFGRMAATNSSLNYDAAAQVAHSISTHAIHNEYDYFTAVDEYKPNDSNAGAGHIDTTEFNSSTLYRYATVNVSELLRNLDKEETLTAVKVFGKAFICSMPAGKQNSFANRTLPDMVYITVRHDQPINLAGAFEEPVKNRKEGYVKASEERLISFAENLYHTFAEEPDAAFGIGNVENLDNIAEVLPLKQALNQLEQTVCKYIEEV
ncbi:MAG: type I-E CRISPR-associated protein Cas7/Cse4/CasC [Lachnospiraceae bacterium]